ncbi:MAG: hypothetical protein FD165_1222 [Gammaproteobacteria bacterium]|nr:MAG: hypothetical protein FD165_1222 [Gammaproteobacteria bacterium]TND07381.1 MAG: hypothetical protein FD120_119 [Gammaproteobacteria bacterium]
MPLSRIPLQDYDKEPRITALRAFIRATGYMLV